MNVTACSRRQLVTGAAGLGAAALVAGATRAQAQEQAQTKTGAYVPGIYEATAQGYKGSMTVHVEVSSDEILSVSVVKNTEEQTLVPSTTATAQICRDIVSKQSLAVDTTTGATFSSMAILSAAQQALEQAGADIDALTASIETPELAHDDEQYDVVVVGSGVAGLMAALSVLTVDLTRESTGRSVLIIERNAFPGGSSSLSDGGYALCSGTVCNEMFDTAFTGDGLADYLEERCGEKLNRELIRHIVDISGSTGTGIFNLGSPFAIAKTELRLKLDNGEGYVSIRAKQYSDPRTDGAFGVRITDNLLENVREMGGELRLRTEAQELIVEDGAVTGVRVLQHTEQGTASYAVRAQKVVLAAGGYALNNDMIEQYAPQYVGSCGYCGGSSKGMGIQMALDATDAYVVGNGLNAYPGTDSRWGMGGELADMMATGLYVNTEGNRFYDGRDVNVRAIGMHICEQPDAMVWAIFDDDTDFVRRGMMDVALERGWGYQADSLEELAELIDVPVENLLASADSMRAAAEAGADAEYNVPENYLNKLAGPHFNAIEVRSVAIGSLAGLAVNENCEVLTSAGEVVPNLLAAGETMIGNVFRSYYPLGSFSIGTCINTGRIAGEQAKATLA